MLEIKGICKSYYGRQVLAPTDLALPSGCCMGLTGENGSGKSTLLRLLAQVERPDGGDILYRGVSVLGDRKFMRQCVGYVPQNQDLMEDLTVARQLKLWQSACDLKGPMPGDILELMGIGPMMPARICTLSGGMQRRVSIAMALMSKPDILIMDEATTGLDKGYREDLLLWLKNYLRQGGRMIWCSHHRQELEMLCDRSLRIEDGRLL